MNNPNPQLMNYIPPCMQMQGMMPMQYGVMPMQYGMMPMQHENDMMPMYQGVMPMMEEDEDDSDLERMYPKSYFIIMPMVRHHCDMMHMKHGMDHRPDKEEVERMVEDIYKEAKDSFHDMEDDESSDDEMRQYRPRRRFGRDLITILLLNELFERRRRRRRRPYGGYGGFSGYDGY